MSAAERMVVRADFTMSTLTDDEADEVVHGMIEAVEAEEPGTIVYAWFRHRDDRKRWSVLEVYEDEAAQKAHLRGPLVRRASARLATAIDEGGVPTQLEWVDAKGIRKPTA
ncbi:MAG: putative quinol monooxygenase [Acidimicrobiia bacterium]